MKRVVVAMLIACLTVTSCVGFTPQVFAETAGDIVTEETQDQETGSGENTPTEPEEDPVPDIITNGWDEDGFYHDDKGEIVKGAKLEIEGLLYSFDADGFSKLFTGFYNQLRYKNGVLHTGWYNYKYYKEGSLLTGIKLSDQGVPYYFTDGVRDKTKFYAYNNRRYKDGKLYTGIYNSYYYNKGAKVTIHKNKVKKVSNGKFYCFKKDGSVFMGTGWKRLNGKRYYIKKGQVYTGWHYIGSYKYFFHKTNASLCQDLIACKGKQWKQKNLMIKVNRKKNCVTIYAKDGKNGYIIPVKALICSVGKKSTPTITGTYTMEAGSGKTYRWHLLGGPGIGPYCWGQYAVRIKGGYMFHSITYDKKDNMTLQTYTYNNLGKGASHGCIRLQVKDAKLIYDIVNYRDTKVKIYDSDYVGPFDKPTIKKIPSNQKYDPTDPYVKK